MLELMHKGGPLMWFILANSIIAIGVFLERLFHYHRAQINTHDFLNGIRNVLRSGNTAEAMSICDREPGPVAHIMKTAIAHHNKPRAHLREAIEETALHEVPRLEKRLGVLATVAQITPLIGFLGTVLGMIRMFGAIQKSPLPNPGDLAGGIWEALLTTASGLAVAIPTYIAYNYLVHRKDDLVLDMERAATEILNSFSAQSDAS
jgi:biopolymer transport protein ExbB